MYDIRGYGDRLKAYDAAIEAVKSAKTLEEMKAAIIKSMEVQRSVFEEEAALEPDDD